MAVKHLVAAMLLAGGLVAVEGALPSCVTTCGADHQASCASASLPALINCLNDHCSSESTLSAYAVTLSPKIEYSCQQSYIPGDESPSPVLSLTGQGQCKTSPYDFQSFIANAGNNPFAAQVCHISVFAGPHCGGQPKDLPLMLHTERCVFEKGRSARLDCSRSSDLSVAHSYVQQLCAGSNSSQSASGSDSTAVSNVAPSYRPESTSRWLSSTSERSVAASTISSSPSVVATYTYAPTGSIPSRPVNNSTVSIAGANSTSTMEPSPPPFLGSAAKESKDATIAVMFALFAALILL